MLMELGMKALGSKSWRPEYAGAWRLPLHDEAVPSSILCQLQQESPAGRRPHSGLELTCELALPKAALKFRYSYELIPVVDSLREERRIP
jgi:hypothetical protein